MAFMSPSAQSVAEKAKWIEAIGTYRYYALILAQFNPVEADLIHNMPAHLIAEAFVSKLSHEFSPKKEQ
jgi:hypothetical protein